MRPMFLRPRSLLAVAATAVLIISAGTALAAGTTVTLKTKGEYAKLHRTACHKTKTFRFFHRGSVIEFRGFLTPPPAGHFAVTIELKRCVRGHWLHVGVRSITGKKLTGKFKGFFSALPLAPRSHRRGSVLYYSARALAGGAQSPKAYFAVTN